MIPTLKLPIPKINKKLIEKTKKEKKKKIEKNEKYLDSFYTTKFLKKYFNEK